MAAQRNQGAAEQAASSTETQVPTPASDQQAQPMDMMMAMMDRFMGMLERSQQTMREEMDRRQAESDRRMEQLLAKMAPEKQAIEERPAVSAVEDAELAPYYNAAGGLIEPPRAPGGGSRRMAKMVAFIPKEDPLNPRQAVFMGWTNGKQIRIRRGQVGMVSRGAGVDWARNKHGHVVDIAAMQGLGGNAEIPVKTAPDFNLPDGWDGRPLTNGSSFAPPRI